MMHSTSTCRAVRVTLPELLMRLNEGESKGEDNEITVRTDGLFKRHISLIVQKRCLARFLLSSALQRDNK